MKIVRVVSSASGLAEREVNNRARCSGLLQARIATGAKFIALS
jgi:hypothetical protein